MRSVKHDVLVLVLSLAAGVIAGCAITRTSLPHQPVVDQAHGIVWFPEVQSSTNKDGILYVVECRPNTNPPCVRTAVGTALTPMDYSRWILTMPHQAAAAPTSP